MNDERLAAVRQAAYELEAMAAGFRPRALVILGSGLGSVADSIDAVSAFPFPIWLHAMAAARIGK